MRVKCTSGRNVMVGGISSKMAGILFSLVFSYGKPQHNAALCPGTGLATITVCLETRSDDRIIRNHIRTGLGNAMPMGTTLALSGVRCDQDSRN